MLRIIKSKPYFGMQNTTDSNVLRKSIAVLLPFLCSAVNEDWYKIIAEALRVLVHIFLKFVIPMMPMKNLMTMMMAGFLHLQAISYVRVVLLDLKF